MENIKLFLVDCDGVLTDGGMYYFESGDEAKKFNTRDGMAFKLLKERNIKIGIITGENTNIVLNRGKKLGMDYIYIGVDNKLNVINKLIKDLNISYNNVLYVGDDLNDLEVIKKVGLSACPSDAQKIIKKNCKYVSNKDGGSGVIRDIYDCLFDRSYEDKNE